jgi:hypothetical protein
MKLQSALVAFALLLSAPALGHDVEKGPNGGRVVDAGSHHIELVVKGPAVQVFVTDANEKPVAATGFKGLAILTVSGKAHRIVLEAKDEKFLSGMAPMALGNAPRGVVQLTPPGGKTVQGRFN